MSDDPYNPTKLFTAEQANAMLPLVRCIVKDMVELSDDMIERRQRLDSMRAHRQLKSDAQDEEIAVMEAEFRADTERLQGFINELVDLGVEPKGVAQGLVDFPSKRNGRIVYLCWKLGEPDIRYWHELDGGFAGRQPLREPLLVDHH
mgnify:CR=1 FL=1